MKTYRITVNGSLFQVIVESVQNTEDAGKRDEQHVTAAMYSAPNAGETLTAPMPGTILSVDIEPGASVKRGQILMILEAMKMENEILCPRDGCVTAVHISKGSAVESGTPLCTIQ